MPNRHFKAKVLDLGAIGNPYLAMADAGMTPAQIKSFVLETLRPFFVNWNHLEEYAIDVLAAEAVSIARAQQHDPWMYDALRHALNLYRRAAIVDPEAAFELCSEHEPSVAASLADYWSALYLEEDKTDLDLHEFKYEVFRNIGSIVEISIQPLLRDILAQVRVGRGKKISFSQIERLTLGNVVDQLHSSASLPELTAPSPWGIRLNQWRNMAQHHRSRVEGDTVVGVFGEPPNEKEVPLTREDLLSVARRLASVYEALRIARKLFIFDHADGIRPYLPEVEVRRDARLMLFVVGVTTQGFQVVDLVADDSRARAVLRDVQDTTDKRLVHASQFLIFLWRQSGSAVVEIEYHDRSGKHRMTFRTMGDACRRLDDEELTIAEYLPFVEFLRVSPGSRSSDQD